MAAGDEAAAGEEGLLLSDFNTVACCLPEEAQHSTGR